MSKRQKAALIATTFLALVFQCEGAAAAARDVTISQLYAFGCDADSGVCSNGSQPNAIILSADGNFYGTTAQGGTGNPGAGTVFKLTPDGQLSTVYSFAGGADGTAPNNLVEGQDGFLYGTTSYGGGDCCGTVFRLSKSGALTVLHNFGADAPYPIGVVFGSDGKLYGGAGTIGQTGILFRISTRGTFKTLHTFDPKLEGGGSLGMVLASDGNFYGTTVLGGGISTVLFRLSQRGKFTVLDTFHYGQFPDSAPTIGTNGKLYGALSRYEQDAAPGMFQTGLSGRTLKQYELQYVFGDNMQFLTAMPDGTLWGSMTSSSDFPNGTLLTYSEKGKPLQTIAFDSANGSDPWGRLIPMSDGSVVGVAETGGTPGNNQTGGGVVFVVQGALARAKR